MLPTHDVLTDLALSRGALDRAGLERRDDGLVKRLLADRGSRVVRLRGELLEVVRDDTGAVALAFSAPQPADVDRLVVDLGRDHEGRAHLAVVMSDPIDGADWADGSDGSWVGLRAVGSELSDRDAGIFTTTLALAPSPASSACRPCRLWSATTASTSGPCSMRCTR